MPHCSIKNYSTSNRPVDASEQCTWLTNVDMSSSPPPPPATADMSVVEMVELDVLSFINNL